MKSWGLIAAFLAIHVSTSAVADPFETEIEQAEQLFVAGDMPAAAEFLEGATARNPYDGMLWLYYGAAKMRSESCATAIEALDRSIELGVNGDRNGMSSALQRRAQCHAELGMNDLALEDLAQAHWRWARIDFDRIAGNPAFADLVATPQFSELRGDLSSEVTRAEGWRQDIRRFEELMRRRHPHGPVITATPEWLATIETLLEVSESASDLTLVEGLMRLAVLAGDGHTGFYPPGAVPSDGEVAPFNILPINVFRFADGWRITAARPDFGELVGGRIESINGVPIDEAEQALFGIIHGDNDFTKYWLGQVALQFLEYNAIISGSTETDQINWQVRLDDGQVVDATFRAQPIDRDVMSPLPPAEWTGPLTEETPMWLSDTENAHWISTELINGALYAQLNAITDTNHSSLEDFSRRIADRMETADTLILDLRLNRGGNGYLIESFMQQLNAIPEVHERGSFFVLIGRQTFSAAGELTGTLFLETEAVFVGEPTAARPTVFASDTEFTLPYSGLAGTISSHFFVNGLSSDDARPWFSPHVHAPASWSSFSRGHDPALLEVARILSSSE